MAIKFIVPNPNKLKPCSRQQVKEMEFCLRRYSSNSFQYRKNNKDKKINHHLQTILNNNQSWVEEKNKDPQFFKNLGKVQTPRFLYFGCSDSRVPANEILGLKYIYILNYFN
jgi:hypothetical protein